MTIRAKLDYSLSTWDNCLPMSRLIQEEYLALLPSIRDGHNVRQLLIMPGDDVFLMKQSINSFVVSAMDVLLCMGRGSVPLNVREHLPMDSQLFRLWNDDAKFRELVSKGDLPSIMKWRTDYTGNE